jgi:hypothetical protein
MIFTRHPEIGILFGLIVLIFLWSRKRNSTGKRQFKKLSEIERDLSNLKVISNTLIELTQKIAFNEYNKSFPSDSVEKSIQDDEILFDFDHLSQNN